MMDLVQTAYVFFLKVFYVRGVCEVESMTTLDRSCFYASSASSRGFKCVHAVRIGGRAQYAPETMHSLLPVSRQVSKPTSGICVLSTSASCSHDRWQCFVGSPLKNYYFDAGINGTFETNGSRNYSTDLVMAKLECAGGRRRAEKLKGSGPRFI